MEALKSDFKESFDSLSETLKSDFQKVDNIPIRAEVRGRYIEVDGKWYRKTYPEMIDSFPRLSEATVRRIYDQWLLLSQGGKAAELIKEKYQINDIDSEYAKGIVLYDTSGRLVEPPNNWKLRGTGADGNPANWFEADGTFTSGSSNLEVQDDNGGKRVYDKNNVEDQLKLNKRPEEIDRVGLGAADIRGSGMNTLEDSLWKIELAVRFQQLELGHSLKGLSQDIKRKTSSQATFAKEKTEIVSKIMSNKTKKTLENMKERMKEAQVKIKEAKKVELNNIIERASSKNIIGTEVSFDDKSYRLVEGGKWKRVSINQKNQDTLIKGMQQNPLREGLVEEIKTKQLMSNVKAKEINFSTFSKKSTNQT